MTRRTRLLAVLCAVVCYPATVLGGSESDLHPSTASQDSLADQEGAGAAEKEPSSLQPQGQPNAAKSVMLSAEILPEEEAKVENEAENHTASPESSAGPRLRRLKGASRKAAAIEGKGRADWGHLLVFLGSLLAGTALWRKTSELYHSPKQALRMAKMRLLGQVPHSWEDYVRNLPVLDELEFSELRPLLKRLEKKPVILMSVPRPRPRLAAFLGLTEEQRNEGIVIKGKATGGCSAKEVAFELFAHEKLAKDLPLSLPALGVYRDYHATTLYLITPRARADVALYTRRMPEKVNLRLAFAEMIYGLWGMHKKGWVHRDIKGCNYFVSQDGHALLADFEGFWRNGMHAIMYGEEVEIIFTQHYISPELTFDGEYQVFDAKSDVYALGVTFKEMLEWMGSLPVPRKELAIDLINHMMETDSKKRYDLKQCMEHPYFEGLDFNLVEQQKYGKAFEGNYMTPYKFL